MLAIDPRFQGYGKLSFSVHLQASAADSKRRFQETLMAFECRQLIASIVGVCYHRRCRVHGSLRGRDEPALFEDRGKGLATSGATIQNVAGVEENSLERHRKSPIEIAGKRTRPHGIDPAGPAA